MLAGAARGGALVEGVDGHCSGRRCCSTVEAGLLGTREAAAATGSGRGAALGCGRSCA